MSNQIRFITNGNETDVYTPYSAEFVSQIKSKLGTRKYDREKGCWTINTEDVDVVKDIVKDVYEYTEMKYVEIKERMKESIQTNKNKTYIAPETIKYMLSLDGKNIEDMTNDELISYLALTTSFIEEQIKAIIEYSEHRDEIYNGTYKNAWNVFMDRIVRKIEWSDYSKYVKKYEPFYPEYKNDNNVQTLKNELENIRHMIDEVVKRAGLENEWKDVLKEEFEWLAFTIKAVNKISENNEIVPFAPFMHTIQVSDNIKAQVVANGNKNLQSDILEALKRYFNKDFGSISDTEKNEVINAKYDTCTKPIYILNQFSGTLTMIMFCDDYE